MKEQIEKLIEKYRKEAARLAVQNTGLANYDRIKENLGKRLALNICISDLENLLKQNQ